jgi:HEAT repeat protein
MIRGSPWKKGVERRCERRGTGCKEPRRGRCRGASGRSGETFGWGGRFATGSREISKAPRGQAPVLTLSAAVREANACGRKLAATPASIFPRAARSTLFIAAVLLGGAAPGLPLAAVFETGWESPPADTREDKLYDQGTKALDDGDWDRAASAFTEVAKGNGARADAALYWVAYALNKQGRKADALAVLGGFSGKFPKSSWQKDVRALELEIRQSGGARAHPEAENDEELKLMALNSLVNTDPERAVPLLEKFLKGGSSRELKERALFVLAQSNSPRARQILAQAARGTSDPELQEKALHYLGIFGGRGNRQLLAEIYASPSSSVEVKEKILHSFMVAGEGDKILAAAKSEKDPRLRSAAVRQLGVMGARAELWQLYQSESSAEVKRAILRGLFIAGDADHLLELARGETNPELRRESIRKLGVMGKEKTGAALVTIYRSEKDPELRRAAIEGLFVQDNAHALIEIARAEKDAELKREAVKKLSVMRDKEATDYLIELLKD